MPTIPQFSDCEMIKGIDIHAHGVPKEFLEEVRRTRLGGVDVVTTDDGGYILTFPNCKPLRPAAGIMLDFTQRLSWLDEQGMQQQLIGPWLDLHGQELPASDGQVWVEDVYACTKWHAIDILYTKMYKYQNNRKMYKLFRPFKTIA